MAHAGGVLCLAFEDWMLRGFFLAFEGFAFGRVTLELGSFIICCGESPACERVGHPSAHASGVSSG